MSKIDNIEEMNEFLETYNLLTEQEEIENLNSLITNEKIEVVISSNLTVSDGFMFEFDQRKINTNSSLIVQNTEII